MRCTVLVENTTLTPALRAEHGLSLLLETSAERWLFDLGASDAFLANAATLGLSLAPLTGVILSHAHNDHGGGLGPWLEIDSKTPIYLSSYAFDRTANATGKDLSLDARLHHAPALRFCSTTTRLSPHATLVYLHPSQHLQPLQPCGLCRYEGGQWQPDDFRHEVALLIEQEGQRILVSGCAHHGALNLLSALQPDSFIGGLHLAKKDPENAADRAALEALVQCLNASHTTVYTGHCTGAKAFAFLRAALGHRLVALSTGLTFETL